MTCCRATGAMFWFISCFALFPSPLGRAYSTPRLPSSITVFLLATLVEKPAPAKITGYGTVCNKISKQTAHLFLNNENSKSKVLFFMLYLMGFVCNTTKIPRLNTTFFFSLYTKLMTSTNSLNNFVFYTQWHYNKESWRISFFLVSSKECSDERLSIFWKITYIKN